MGASAHPHQKKRGQNGRRHDPMYKDKQNTKKENWSVDGKRVMCSIGKPEVEATDKKKKKKKDGRIYIADTFSSRPSVRGSREEKKETLVVKKGKKKGPNSIRSLVPAAKCTK